MPGNIKNSIYFNLNQLCLCARTMNEVFSVGKNLFSVKTKFLIFSWFSTELAYVKLNLKINGVNLNNLSIEQWKIKVVVAFSQFMGTVISKFLMFLSSKNLTIHVSTPLVLPLIRSIFEKMLKVSH